VSAQPEDETEDEEPFGAALLESLRTEFEAGDKSRLIAAMAFCVCHNLVMPEWVANAFLPGANQWLHHEVKELGDALGVSWPKGMQQPAAQQKKKLMWLVFNRVEELHCTPTNPGGEPVGEYLFELVAGEFGIKTSGARDYYYSAKYWLDGDPS